MKLLCITWLALGGVSWLVSTPAAGQSPQNAEQATATATPADKFEKSKIASTTQDPAIPIRDLELLITPLTQTELIDEANAWQGLLRENMIKIADLRIKLRDSNDKSLVTKLATLIDKKSQIARHFGVVIDALEAKGGNVKEYRQYAMATAGVAVEFSNFNTLMSVMRNWLKSDDGGIRWGWNLLKFLMVVTIFYIGASIAANVVCRFARHIKGTSQLLLSFLRTFTKQLILLIGFIMALKALEWDVTPMLAALGAAGFVVGFALKDTLGNFASGIMILAYRPFDVGDQIDAANVTGLVESVSLFATHIRTFDNKMTIIPNNKIWGDIITNATASDTRRVDMIFGIGYDDDIETANHTLLTLLKQHPLVLKEPAPVVKLHELGDSSVNFICRPWTKTHDYWSVYWDITQSVKETFDQKGISIPYPQRDVHLHQEVGMKSTQE